MPLHLVLQNFEENQMRDKLSIKQTLGQEPLLTLPEAAAQLGVPVSTLRRAVNAGHIPTHQLFNSRIRVRLSEVLAAIQMSREG